MIQLGKYAAKLPLILLLTVVFMVDAVMHVTAQEHETSLAIPLTTEKDNLPALSAEKPTMTFFLTIPQTGKPETHTIQSFSAPRGITISFTDNEKENGKFSGKLFDDEFAKKNTVQLKERLEFKVAIEPAILPADATLIVNYRGPQGPGIKHIGLTSAPAAASASPLTVDPSELTLEAGQRGQAGPWMTFKVTLHRKARGDEPVPRVSFEFEKTLFELETQSRLIYPDTSYNFASEPDEVQVLEAQVRLREGVGQQAGKATLKVLLERSDDTALVPISWQAWMPQPKLWIEPEGITVQAGRSGSPGPFVPFIVHLTHTRAPETEAPVAAFAFDARLFELQHQDEAVVIREQQVPFKPMPEHEWQLPMQARLRADAVSREGDKRLKVLVRLPLGKFLERQLHLNWQPGPGRRWFPVVLVVVVGVVVVVGCVIGFIRSYDQSRRTQRDSTHEVEDYYDHEVQSEMLKSSAASTRLPPYYPSEKSSSEPGHAAGVTSRAQEERHRESSQRLHAGKKAALPSEVTPQGPQETVERLIQDQREIQQELKEQLSMMAAKVCSLQETQEDLRKKYEASAEGIVERISDLKNDVTQWSSHLAKQQTQFESIHDTLEQLRIGVPDKMDHLEQQLACINEDLQATESFTKSLMGEFLRTVLQDQTQIHTAMSQFFGISKLDPEVFQALQPLHECSVAIHAALKAIQQRIQETGDARGVDIEKVLEKSAQFVREFEQYKQGYHNKQLDVLVTVDPYAPETIPERMAWSIRSAMQKMHDPMQYFSDKLDRFVCQDLVRVVDICDDGFPGTEQEDAIQRLLHASELEDISPNVGERYDHDSSCIPVGFSTGVSRDIITKVERRGFRYKGKRIREARLVVGE